MKTLIATSLLLLSLNACAQKGELNLPEKWENDFAISLSYSGSMSGSSTHITFTHDSCTYTADSRHKGPKQKKYLLKESDRIEILKKLSALKVDQLQSASSVKVVNDGWSQSICFGFHCVEAGTSSDISDDDKDLFLSAYNYLQDFAMRKAK